MPHDQLLRPDDEGHWLNNPPKPGAELLWDLSNECRSVKKIPFECQIEGEGGEYVGLDR